MINANLSQFLDTGWYDEDWVVNPLTFELPDEIPGL